MINKQQVVWSSLKDKEKIKITSLFLKGQEIISVAKFHITDGFTNRKKTFFEISYRDRSGVEHITTTPAHIGGRQSNH